MSDISPMRQGDTDPPMLCRFYDKNGNLQILPTGTTFQVIITEKNSGVPRTGAGTFDTSNIASGSVIYNWSANDTAIKGDFWINVRYTKPDTKTGSSDREPWKVE
jgi:hypothetical protein